MNTYIYTIQEGKGYWKGPLKMEEPDWDKHGYVDAGQLAYDHSQWEQHIASLPSIEYIGSPSDFKEGEIVSEDRLRFDQQPYECVNGYWVTSPEPRTVAYKAEQQQAFAIPEEDFEEYKRRDELEAKAKKDNNGGNIEDAWKPREKDNVASDNKDEAASVAALRSGQGNAIEQGKYVFGEWQICPKCNGTKTLPIPWWVDPATGNVQSYCFACNEHGLIARPLMPLPEKP